MILPLFQTIYWVSTIRGQMIINPSLFLARKARQDQVAISSFTKVSLCFLSCGYRRTTKQWVVTGDLDQSTESGGNIHRH